MPLPIHDFDDLSGGFAIFSVSGRQADSGSHGCRPRTDDPFARRGCRLS
jgi:hypothetical protein